MRNIFYKQRLY